MSRAQEHQSHCWGLATQIGLIKLVPNVPSVPSSLSLPPAEVEQVKVDALLTCDSLLLPDALLLCCYPRGNAGDDLPPHRACLTHA